MKKIISLVIAATLTLSLIACGNKASASVPDGTYQGTGIGKGGDIVVELTMKDSMISDIKVISQDESEGLDKAIDIMKAEMLATNSTDADAVSGATLTSAGFRMAVNDAFKKTGADKSVLVTKEKPAKEAREEEYTADVIVIGAGGAGLTAAITAAENGKEVIVLEKMPIAGGNTLISGGEYAAPKNWVQESEKLEDSKDLFYEDIMKGGDNESDPALARILADQALDGAKWLKDEVGMIFEDYMLFFGGHSVERSLVPKNATGYEMISKLSKKLEETGSPLHLNTEATELIQDETGKITGVTATYHGKTITYHATGGVIIASGGFGYNKEMRAKYNPKMNEGYLSTNSVGSTGDGLVMAEKIGGVLTDMEYIQAYPTCDTQSGALLYVGDVRLEGRSILVNKEGKRFVEELERRDVISNAVLEQTGGVSYMFFDESAMVDSKVSIKHASEYNGLLARKQLVKADTLEEAAAFFDIDAEELKKTVENYNQYAKDGKDLEFSKRGTLVPFEEGPYYIMVSKPAIHHTMGGVKINTSAQVVKEDGSVIEGLFAAGEVVGDIHGTNRLGSDAIADITVFGRIAGESASK
ncbi:flavocytochrome c [Proteiniclasticum sp.]|uniref:flavocytochrome c n=1 Tax=Proteiniclasticum sp. TaxID=2053595 RepID=UPI002898EB76|nr:flavocytochrome c [Proteiniclasticum sp.]